ncbi:hypothetical protein AAG570_009473 [Ranatra chinensis]|uniref:Rac GTPase-activating protein 1 n=1 Tax=Ranatra chinensis TaxID=642074 RepID=A0ABD0YPA2_9HEMI
MVRDLLLRDKNKLNDETKEKLHFLNTRPSMDHLDTITELESTGSVLSDLSYTRDEDDLLIMSSSDTRSKKRRSGSTPFIGKTKRRKSSTTKTVEVNPNERLIATTTVTVEHSGPVNARSVIETIPSNNPPRESSDENDPCKTPTNSMGPSTPFSMNFINTRPHTFINRAMIKGELCNVCCKRVRFSAMGAKCKDCKAVCHVHCKDRAPIPCVPINTPTSKGNVGSIADYTPQTGLMVPSLVIHCIKEIESRGMTEVGLYRVPGSDKEVRHLKEKFLKGKGVPNLANIPDIHTVCGCLKDFLRSLREPLITQIRWADFSKATDIKDVEERRKRLHQIIDELPQPNRDTLAYVVLHLKRVAEVPDCKMPVANLAKMFGPSIVGFPKYDSLNALADANQANKVQFFME